jgi:hypothetical protein
MTPAVQQRSVPVAPRPAVGRHRAETPLPGMSPWVSRGLTIGTLAAGLWLVGSLSHSTAADAATMPPRPQASPAVIGMPASPHTGPLGAAGAVPISSHQPANGIARGMFHHSEPGKAESGDKATRGVLSRARSGVGGMSPTPGSAAARRVISTVVNADRPISPVTALPVPGVTVPVVTLPVVALPAPTSPVAAVPIAVVPVAAVPVAAAPALPAVAARPAAPAERTVLQPPRTVASEATTVTTHRNHNAVSSRAPVCIGQWPGNHAAAALPQQPGTPPAGRHPGLVPALSLGSGGGNNPLDGGLLATNLARLDGTTAGDNPSRAGTPPRERASAPSTSPD